MKFTRNLDNSITYNDSALLNTANSVYSEEASQLSTKDYIHLDFYYYRRAGNRFLELDNKETYFQVPFSCEISTVTWRNATGNIGSPNNGICIGVADVIHNFDDNLNVGYSYASPNLVVNRNDTIKVYQRNDVDRPIVKLILKPAAN